MFRISRLPSWIDNLRSVACCDDLRKRLDDLHDQLHSGDDIPGMIRRFRRCESPYDLVLILWDLPPYSPAICPVCGVNLNIPPDQRH